MKYIRVMGKIVLRDNVDHHKLKPEEGIRILFSSSHHILFLSLIICDSDNLLCSACNFIALMLNKRTFIIFKMGQIAHFILSYFIFYFYILLFGAITR